MREWRWRISLAIVLQMAVLAATLWLKPTIILNTDIGENILIDAYGVLIAVSVFSFLIAISIGSDLDYRSELSAYGAFSNVLTSREKLFRRLRWAGWSLIGLPIFVLLLDGLTNWHLIATARAAAHAFGPNPAEFAFQVLNILYGLLLSALIVESVWTPMQKGAMKDEIDRELTFETNKALQDRIVGGTNVLMLRLRDYFLQNQTVLTRIEGFVTAQAEFVKRCEEAIAILETAQSEKLDVKAVGAAIETVKTSGLKVFSFSRFLTLYEDPKSPSAKSQRGGLFPYNEVRNIDFQECADALLESCRKLQNALTGPEDSEAVLALAEKLADLVKYWVIVRNNAEAFYNTKR